ncbi:exosome complex exonuclease rrp6 [Moniliophthora roreri MCA 2997]|uniref:Exosome complex exonuclease rrp6 n=1 Tax=Moniliophthora roreri (strain MCA 2997) TaxID=1381753 RepID=V2XRV5_MONRO|nr:exosome complex exonuclease rrp6 [Moniliophthora roreri MCA 2997]
MESHGNAAAPSSSFDEFNSQLQGMALKATRNSMLLPVDIPYHRSMDSEFSKELDNFSARVISLANKLLTLAGTVDASGKGKGKLQNEDDVVDNFHALVVDSMDQMLERTDICLDEIMGRNKAPAIAINPKAITAPTKKKAVLPKGQLDTAIQHASHLPKPQLSFKTKVDNSDAPWRPHLSHKYNARVPLGYQLRDNDVDMIGNDLVKLHPYRYEINHITYPAHMFESATPIPPSPLNSSSFKWVSDVTDLDLMVEELKKAKEVAIDLEHHSYRSYTGFLCLMQISTREQDWIVDLLVLRGELEVLNEVFTDPKIIKVLHGAESDVVWLQQDLNLYIVNLFDTFHASKVLGFPRHGLANLLEMYCDFTPDKRYQLADWRIRPLPEEMVDYARSDTHFLLYIYDNLRNALLDRARSQSISGDMSMAASSSKVDPLHALIRDVLSRSEETALRVYEKEYYDAESGSGSAGWDTLARKWNKTNLYNNSTATGILGMQREVYKRVHNWRDQVAREEDESTRYVLPNHFIFQLAEQPPADMAALLRAFHSVPPVIRRRAKELLEVIREAVKYHMEAGSKPDTIATKSESEQENRSLSPQSKEIIMSDSTSQISLWSNHASLSGKLTTSNSTLFGSVATISNLPSTTPSRNSLATATSKLFGKPVSTEAQSRQKTARFNEVVARIHKALVIVPSAAKTALVTNAEGAQTETPGEVDDEDESILPSDIQPEVPFVPASQRASKVNEIVEDTIVVVGQTKQKKRKRTKATGAGGEPSGEPEDTTRKRKRGANSQHPDDVTGAQEEFDFSSVPNILDEPPPPSAADEPSTNKKKGKARQNKEKAFYGNFPAPPKAHSELKSANKSRTFK